MPQRHFYALLADLAQTIQRIEDTQDLSYALCGLHELPTFQSYSNAVTLPAFREPVPRSSAASPTYLITPRDVTVVVRPVPQNGGGELYAIDQLVNPDSITFTPGGLHPTGPLVAGRIATSSDSPIAKRLYSVFQRALQRDFKRVQSYWVGPRALDLFHAGARLTFDISSPRDFDLRLP